MRNPESKSRSDARWRERNRATLRLKQAEARFKLKLETLDVYGRRCAECGYDDIRALHIDHIHNNGSEERRLLGGKNFSGYRFYQHLKKMGWPSGYQTLCANCNFIKQYGDIPNFDTLPKGRGVPTKMTLTKDELVEAVVRDGISVTAANLGASTKIVDKHFRVSTGGIGLREYRRHMAL